MVVLSHEIIYVVFLIQILLLVEFRYTKLKNAIPKVWIKHISEFNTYDGNINQTDDTDLHEIKTHNVI